MKDKMVLKVDMKNNDNIRLLARTLFTFANDETTRNQFDLIIETVNEPKEIYTFQDDEN